MIGFLLPLSGGADSASVAVIVHVMCKMAVLEAQQENAVVVSDMQTILQHASLSPENIAAVRSDIQFTVHHQFMMLHQSLNPKVGRCRTN